MRVLLSLPVRQPDRCHPHPAVGSPVLQWLGGHAENQHSGEENAEPRPRAGRVGTGAGPSETLGAALQSRPLSAASPPDIPCHTRHGLTSAKRDVAPAWRHPPSFWEAQM